MVNFKWPCASPPLVSTAMARPAPVIFNFSKSMEDILAAQLQKAKLSENAKISKYLLTSKEGFSLCYWVKQSLPLFQQVKLQLHEDAYSRFDHAPVWRGAGGRRQGALVSLCRNHPAQHHTSHKIIPACATCSENCSLSTARQSIIATYSIWIAILNITT